MSQWVTGGHFHSLHGSNNQLLCGGDVSGETSEGLGAV